MVLSGIADEAGDHIDTQIAAHREIGWDHLELRLINGNNICGDAPEADFREAARAVEESGMHVSGFGSAIGNWSRHIRGDFEVDRRELETAIARMKRLNVSHIRIMSWPGHDVPETEWRAETVRRLSELTKMAEDAGIVLCHENCRGWGGLTAERMLEVQELIDSPSFKLLYDIGNAITHRLDAAHFFDVIRGQFEYVHVKDAVWDRSSDEIHFKMCGEGEAMVAEILDTIIRKDGYDGVISIEPHIASVVHLGESANKSPQERFESYVSYGKTLMSMVEQIRRS